MLIEKIKLKLIKAYFRNDRIKHNRVCYVLLIFETTEHDVFVAYIQD